MKNIKTFYSCSTELVFFKVIGAERYNGDLNIGSPKSGLFSAQYSDIITAFSHTTIPIPNTVVQFLRN